MILNGFYEIISTREEGSIYVFSIKLNPSHQIYEGHFVEQPIVPGVCSVQMIKDCAEKLVGKKLQYARISSCKFLSLVEPNTNNELDLELSLSETEGSIALSAEGKYKGTNTVFIKLKATLNII